MLSCLTGQKVKYSSPSLKVGMVVDFTRTSESVIRRGVDLMQILQDSSDGAIHAPTKSSAGRRSRKSNALLSCIQCLRHPFSFVNHCELTHVRHDRKPSLKILTKSWKGWMLLCWKAKSLSVCRSESKV